MAGRDLYIVDADYNTLGNELKAYADFLATQTSEFINALNYINTHAIKSGNINLQIKGLSGAIKELPAAIKNVGENAKSLCGSYISEIDEADKYLYGAK
jgi:hypothetical protein